LQEEIYYNVLLYLEYNNPSATKGMNIKGDIEFENVSFKYPMRNEEVFNNLSFKINASNKIGIVGPSGCGKSTIFQLILRFYDVDSGRILLDGIDIRNYDVQFLRECFGVVQQEPLLFNGTIEYNIKYKKPDASDDEMKKAAEMANALKFIIENQFGKKKIIQFFISAFYFFFKLRNGKYYD
jgi:ATP-binding cassette, subfamily B (MDR/TAP), member 1